MSDTANETQREAKNEEIRSKNFKPVNPHIKNHLGSQKIKDSIFGGVKSHKENIVPYPDKSSKR